MYKAIIKEKIQMKNGYRYKLECINCHKTFFLAEYKVIHAKIKGGKFCSMKCLNEFQKKFPHTKKLTGKKLQEHPAWKGGEYIHPTGYKYVYKPKYKYSNKKGYIREHRYIIELFLRRKLKNNEVVHHKNKNKLDNRLENLEILNPSEHFKKYHGKEWFNRVGKNKKNGLFISLK